MRLSSQNPTRRLCSRCGYRDGRSLEGENFRDRHEHVCRILPNRFIQVRHEEAAAFMACAYAMGYAMRSQPRSLIRIGSVLPVGDGGFSKIITTILSDKVREIV